MKQMSNKTLRGPLKSWDIYTQAIDKQAEAFIRNTEIAVLNEFKERYHWNLNIEETLNNTTFEAIILTNIAQEIEWVNKGFISMTGYPVNYAKGKKPSFLQGQDSSKEVLKKIRTHIAEELHIKERIINYRKNGEKYICDIEIFPVKDVNGKLAHLLALEKEVYTLT
ncbi:PAS domain-containing protein [Pontimicrobium sp. MEBiC01747]